jgi:hypothetical protein
MEELQRALLRGDASDIAATADVADDDVKPVGTFFEKAQEVAAVIDGQLCLCAASVENTAAGRSTW